MLMYKRFARNNTELRHGGRMERMEFPSGFFRDGQKRFFDGVELSMLAREFGTPLYVMSESIIRGKCRVLRDTFINKYPRTKVYYASKAFSTLEMVRIIQDEGFGLDVVSGGELYAALKAGVSPASIIFHGNAKTDEEIHYAVKAGVGRIAVDNLEEIFRIESEAERIGIKQAILLRVTPGVDSHTHRFISTGSLDSKFGIPLEFSETTRYVEALKACSNVELKGLHFHIGSQLLENTSHLAALKIVLGFATRLYREHGISLEELNMGGGFGIRYLPHDASPSISDFVDPMMEIVNQWSIQENIPMPTCAIEPGRWIVGEAGITLYKIIATKKIPGIRTYVAVDGGMGDNIRPALYNAPYFAEIVGTYSDQRSVLNDRELCNVTIAGRYCESGDILIRDIDLKDPHAGDIVAFFSTGAYCFAMSSNYNRVPRPALVFVKDGKARLSVRRESFEDLVRREY